MSEFDQLVEQIERDLDIERCMAALPQLLSLAADNQIIKTKAYLLAAKCNYVARQFNEYVELLNVAKDCASGSLEATVRVHILEASLACSAGHIEESQSRLAFAEEHFDQVGDEIRGLILSIRGRNEALVGKYAEAIETSQEAIALSPPLSLTSAFSHGTIALVFHTMGRIQESEYFGLEQIRIYKERGSEKWTTGLYSMLSVGAASIGDYERAHKFQEAALEMVSTQNNTSSLRTLSLLWTANSELELGKLDSALHHGLTALEAAREESNTPLQMNAWIALGQIYHLRAEHEEALRVLTIPLEQEKALGDNLRMNLYRWLTATYKALDRRAEAFDICYRLWELQTDFETRTRDALIKYHRSLEQKIFAQKTSMLNMRSAQMERELALSATQLVAQVDLLGRFRNDLREIVRESQSADPAMKKIKEKLKELPCQQIDWVNFESQFSSVHPDFKSKLQEKHPDLTRSEIKICSLSRMKLTSEEIGRLLCLSDRTVQVHRLNIRKKLGLKTEQNLGAYLAQLG